ncbi:UPF0178 protein [Kordiimonas sediminis]|uniref:UPF0178 protein GCM10017044_16620 n=1 Tax=Kordiimonas sediminis TaxID=1735581 RepID=A0A919E8B6_9PROT|nr:YaiI/YqxD family protein [Kordiimonas sediminis]GHF22906.1 UPF0178 protein [Kordiimonas sediminis]
MTTPVLYIDADACPVKEEALKVAYRHNMKTYLVSNQWLRMPVSDLVEKIVVSDGFDAADDWIAERAEKGAIVVTGDIPLADRCLKNGAMVLGHNGRPFTQANIGAAMAMRSLKSDLRDMGEISGAGPAFSKKDRSTFLNELERMVQATLRL